MEKEFFKALLETLLEPRTDQYGSRQPGMLSTIIEQWANGKREDIAAEVVKKLKVGDLAEKVASKVVEELNRSSSWSTNYQAENLKDMVMKKVADKLAEQQLEKLNKI